MHEILARLKLLEDAMSSMIERQRHMEQELLGVRAVQQSLVEELGSMFEAVSKLVNK